MNDSPDLISQLRREVEREGFVLTPRSYEAVRRLYCTASSSFDGSERWKAASPEYGTEEYFRSVDECGRSVSTAAAILEDFRRTSGSHPDFCLWFNEVAHADQQQSVTETLLPARWLCHLAGFRHLSVHLFLTVLGDDKHLLVQVRGTEKAESPGAFDLPVAGHVAGEQSEEEALIMEANEELGLTTDDLVGVRALGGYEYREPDSGSWMRNVEFRILFEAALALPTYSRLRPAPDEVGAIALFSISAVDSMIASFPERVASGLRSSFPIYRAKHRPEAFAFSDYSRIRTAQSSENTSLREDFLNRKLAGGPATKKS